MDRAGTAGAIGRLPFSVQSVEGALSVADRDAARRHARALPARPPTLCRVSGALQSCFNDLSVNR